MNTTTSTKWIRNMFLISVTAVIFCVILFHFISDTQSIRFQPEEQSQLADSWLLNGKTSLQFPSEITLKKNETLTLSCRLPEKISKNDAIFYNASYCSQRVYVNDTLIYHFADTPQLPFGNMSGSAYALVNLKPEYAGKTLTIEMSNPYDQVTYNMSGIYFGDRGEFKFELLKNNIWRYAIFHVFSFIALASFVFALYILLSNLLMHLGVAFMYFSVLVLSMGIWIFCDPSIMQFFTNHSATVQFLSLFSLLFVGSSYMGLCACFMRNQRKTFHTLELIGYLLVLLHILLYLTGKLNFTFLLYCVVIYAVFYLGVSTVCFIKHYKEYDFSRFLIVGTFVLFLGVCITIIKFTRDPSGTSAVIAFTISFVIYVTCLFVIMIKESIKIIRISNQSNLYEHMAFTDQLTGIPNRAAFDRVLDTLESSSSVSGEVILCICDLNYLKKTNDEMGHHAGDELIQQAAQCLEQTFRPYGIVYRLGGDEFAIPLINPDISMSELIDQLDRNIQKHNNSSSLILSIAIGYAKRPLPLTTDDDEIDIFRAADANMYESKKKMHTARV